MSSPAPGTSAGLRFTIRSVVPPTKSPGLPCYVIRHTTGGNPLIEPTSPFPQTSPLSSTQPSIYSADSTYCSISTILTEMEDSIIQPNHLGLLNRARTEIQSLELDRQKLQNNLKVKESRLNCLELLKTQAESRCEILKKQANEECKKNMKFYQEKAEEEIKMIREKAKAETDMLNKQLEEKSKEIELTKALIDEMTANYEEGVDKARRTLESKLSLSSEMIADPGQEQSYTYLRNKCMKMRKFYHKSRKELVEKHEAELLQSQNEIRDLRNKITELEKNVEVQKKQLENKNLYCSPLSSTEYPGKEAARGQKINKRLRHEAFGVKDTPTSSKIDNVDTEISPINSPDTSPHGLEMDIGFQKSPCDASGENSSNDARDNGDVIGLQSSIYPHVNSLAIIRRPTPNSEAVNFEISSDNSNVQEYFTPSAIIPDDSNSVNTPSNPPTPCPGNEQQDVRQAMGIDEQEEVEKSPIRVVDQYSVNVIDSTNAPPNFANGQVLKKPSHPSGFVLVKVIPTSTMPIQVRYFVASITQSSFNLFTRKLQHRIRLFMKARPGSGHKLAFTCNEGDITSRGKTEEQEFDIEEDNIVADLPKPEKVDNRSRHIFNFDFEPYPLADKSPHYYVF